MNAMHAPVPRPMLDGARSEPERRALRQREHDMLGGSQRRKGMMVT